MNTLKGIDLLLNPYKQVALLAAVLAAHSVALASADVAPVDSDAEDPGLTSAQILDSPMPGVTRLGALRPKTSAEIVDSCVSVGFECLDREMFDPERCYDKLAESGAKYARCQTGWARCEKRKGEYDFTWLDTVVDNLSKRGVEAWFNVGYGNPLYMTNCYSAAAVGHVPLYYGETCKAAWCAYVRALSRHFKGRVRYWEIWNEANISAFWVPGGADPAKYIELIRLTALHIRAEIPDALIGGGVSSVYEKYVLAFIDLGGGRDLDFWCVHPYSTAPEHLMYWDAKFSYVDAIAETRARFATNGAPSIAIWNGESGYNYWFPKGHWLYGNKEDILSAADPAKWLLRRFVTDRRAGCAISSYFQMVDMVKPYVKSSTTWKKPPKGGLLDGETYEPRMSWRALRNYNALLANARYDTSVATEAEPGSKHPALTPIEAVPLRSGDRLFFVYWAKTFEVKNRYPGRLDARLFVPAVLAPKEPVLVDLLRGDVYTLARVPELSADGKTALFSRLPVTDYPLVLAERASVDFTFDK